MDTEKALQNYVRRLCKQNGVLFYKFASPAHRGVPDLILIGVGRVVFVELKSPNKKGILSPLQAREIECIRSMQIEAYVINCPDDARELITSLAVVT